MPAISNLRALARVNPAEARGVILYALDRHGGNLVHSAAYLELPERTLRRVIGDLGLWPEIDHRYSRQPGPPRAMG